MMLSPTQLAQSRNHTLCNLLGFSIACLDAGQRMTNLFAKAGHETINLAEPTSGSENGQVVETMASPWLSDVPATHFVPYVEEIYEILGDTHKAAITAAQAQIHAFDQVVIASIEQSRRFSPWETDIALRAMRNTLEGVEHSLESVSQAAIGTVDLVEKEVHQISVSLTENAPKGRSKTNNR